MFENFKGKLVKYIKNNYTVFSFQVGFNFFIFNALNWIRFHWKNIVQIKHNMQVNMVKNLSP